MRAKPDTSARLLLLALIPTLLVLVTCFENEEFVFEGIVSIEAQDSSLVIFNQTNVTIYVFPIEQEVSKVFDLRFCDHPDECGHTAIKPGDSKEIPHTGITGWKLGAVVLVYLYYLLESSASDSGYQVEMLPMQTVDMPLE